MNVWPFPPPGGPVPLTPKQLREYAKQQRQQQQRERDNTEPAPF